jgi:hypothetical protein
MSLSNIEVEYLCKYLKIPLVSCCLQDEIINLNVKDGGYIINYGNRENGGTHYVAFYIFENYCFLFDSFGAPFDSDVLKFVDKIKNKAYNQWIIQDIKDDHCGFYCVAFLFYAYNFAILPNQLFKVSNFFINNFKTTSEKNLNILKALFKPLIKDKDISRFDKSIYNKIKI